jgi:hypothetical protein
VFITLPPTGTAAADYGPEIRQSWSPPITPERVDRYRLAREKGLKELHLDSSLTAERFYTAHGYLSEDRGEHTLRDGLRMICVPMQKAL